MEGAFHLTPLDVRRYDFGTALRGYDKARVDQFREQVANELERLTRVNQELDSKARTLAEQLKSFNYAIGQMTAVGVARAGVAAAGTVFIMIVPIIVFVVSQSNIIETMGSSGMKD